MNHRGLVFILDGLGDRPCRQLRGRTPLEAAKTRALDRMARLHQCGMMDPLAPGRCVDTHVGAGILLGLPPREALSLRRGPVEAAGIGLDMRAGDVLWRANFARIEAGAGANGGYRILDRRAGRIRGGETESLCAALNSALRDDPLAPGIGASLHAATQHRAVLQLRGENLSAQVSDTDPGGPGAARGVQRAAPLVEDAAARATADAVNRFTARAHQLLSGHPVNTARASRGQCPANGVLLRGAGAHHPPRNMLARLRLKVAVVAGEKTVLGLGNLFGFTCITDESFTSLPDTNIAGKLRAALDALARHDLVFVHIKGTDIAAHDKNPLLKAACISRFDRELSRVQLDDTVVAVCADHSTDSRRGEHNADAVPVLLRHVGGRRDRVRYYNEIDCIDGGLGRISAHAFLCMVLDAMGAAGGMNGGLEALD
ncbi:MAG: alkaline phosphatase family protein [Gammaproteobacteria bacterium]|nr:alkaline phosphatase family protein [Gammaproteobacteria bacterium]